MPVNINLKRWSLIILGLILTIALVILVWNKEPTIYPYLFVSIALSVLITFSIIGCYKGIIDRSSTIVLIFMIFLFLRNVQFIATQYMALTPDDVTFEYSVIKYFSEANRIFVIPNSPFSNMLSWYSSWPLLHSLSMIFSSVLDINIALIPVLLPSVFSTIGFLFTYLIVNRLVVDLKLNNVIVPLSLLLYSIAPEAIYFGFKFVRNSLAAVFILMGFHLLYRYYRCHDSRVLGLIVLNTFVIVLTHHYSSFIYTAFLLAIATLSFIVAMVLNVKSRLKQITIISDMKKEAVITGVVGLLSVGLVVIWWSQVGTIIQEVASGVTGKITQSVFSGIRQIGPEILEAFYPEQLTPSWIKLLWIRDVLVYIPVFYGFIWLIRQAIIKKAVDYSWGKGFWFLILSLVSFGLFFLFELFVSHVETFRIVLLCLPLVVICSAIMYEKMISYKRIYRGLAFIALAFSLVCSSLGLWGHRYAPIDLYCASVTGREAGEPMIIDNRHYELQEFVMENELDKTYSGILSDDNSLLYRLLSPQEYLKIGPNGAVLYVELNRAISEGDNTLVINYDSNFYSHYWGGYPAIELDMVDELLADYHTKLEACLNKIYNSGFEVYCMPSK